MNAKVNTLLNKFWEACEKNHNAADIVEIAKNAVGALTSEINTLEKKVAELEGQVQAQPVNNNIQNLAEYASNRISQGISSLNQIRTEIGLEPIKNELANKLYITKGDEEGV